MSASSDTSRNKKPTKTKCKAAKTPENQDRPGLIAKKANLYLSSVAGPLIRARMSTSDQRETAHREVRSHWKASSPQSVS